MDLQRPLVFTLMKFKNLHNWLTDWGWILLERIHCYEKAELFFDTKLTCSCNLILLGGFVYEASQTLEMIVSGHFTDYIFIV